MEQIVVKKEPEELVDNIKGDISMNYDKPSTSADPSTSGIAIKQEIKEELDDSNNYMIYDELGVKEDSETYTDEDYDFDGAKQVKEEMFLDQGTDSEVVNEEIPSKIVLPKTEKESLEEQCLKPGGEVEKEKLFKCAICFKAYQSQPGLCLHKKYVHKKEEQEEFKCKKCDYVTLRKGNFKVHLRNHDKKNYLKCNFCNYMAARLATLNAHLISKHRLENEGENKIEITSKIHQCTKCLYSTVIKSHYDSHVKVCLNLKNVKWFKCEICNFKSIHEFHLNRHKKTHNKIKQFTCLFCQYQSNEKRHLDNHILTKHSDALNESNENVITSKVHCCQQCNYKTIFADHLKKHLSFKH
ncbi:unnamed protein product [Brassicogethes aeneus]|uniref:C2H2-type domain-containing protein n=1 Tax=Brassicogethes aeneus TaxID=1431903 RepID=A0A9P0BJP1_BRAAE|nr:unnamed protein product [Brassicogethes aeneus]